MLKILIKRSDLDLEVLLIKHKVNGKYSFVNLTKGHICPCLFTTEEEALQDLNADKRVFSWSIIEVTKKGASHE